MPYPGGTLYPSASTFPASGTVVTVVPNPAFKPPRMEITCSIPTGNVMVSATLSRVVDGVAEQVLAQPSPGFDSRRVDDYTAPYDQDVTYLFETTYTDPTAVSTVWDEVWASLSNWTGDTSKYNVAGGTVVLAATGPGLFTITRTLPASASYRARVLKLTASGTDSLSARNSGVQFVTAAGAVVLQLMPNLDGTISVQSLGSSAVVTGISGSSPITVDFLATSIVVTGTGGSYTVSSLGSTTYSRVQVTTNYHNPGTFAVGEIEVSSYGQTRTVSEASLPATLSPEQAWLIHPASPSLSMPVSSPDRSAATIRVLGELTNGSPVTEHQILGEKFPITTTSGPRLGGKLQATIGVRTRQQEQALMGLLDDGTPIMFRAPASYPIGIDEGFYSVGDISRARISQRLGDTMRDFTLPLTQVQTPVVTVQNVGWSWAALAAEFSTWAAVAQAFNTWADVLANNRKPGY